MRSSIAVSLVGASLFKLSLAVSDCGGFALFAGGDAGKGNCPAGTKLGNQFSDFCCPDGTSLDTTHGYQICCPLSNPTCSAGVSLGQFTPANGVACADPSWVLWGHLSQPNQVACCEQGFTPDYKIGVGYYGCKKAKPTGATTWYSTLSQSVAAACATGAPAATPSPASVTDNQTTATTGTGVGGASQTSAATTISSASSRASSTGAAAAVTTSAKNGSPTTGVGAWSYVAGAFMFAVAI